MRTSKIATGQTSNNVGFSATQGFTRKLTKRELALQKSLQRR